MIYFAPLQGFTDFVYRASYNAVFEGIDKYFIPYVAVKNGAIVARQLNEILPGNNWEINVVPQILVKDAAETNLLVQQLAKYEYKEANLNLGCPYPMATNRPKGSGLLPHPEEVRKILAAWFHQQDMALSVKLRLGLCSVSEIEEIIPVLNDFPLTEVILHPRTARQLYSGNLCDDNFSAVQQKLRHNIVFNGDIFSVADARKRQQQFPGVTNWMLGRGILMNPFLPAEIKHKKMPITQKNEMLRRFHNRILEHYLRSMDNPGNAVNKMKQFWSYFSYNFPNQEKVFRQIKKSKDLIRLKASVAQIFNGLD